MKKFLIFLTCLSVTSCVGQYNIRHESSPVIYVNPLMGCGAKENLSFGGTYPYVSVPFGEFSWIPQTSPSGEHLKFTYSGSYLRGFRMTRTSSAVGQDFGSVVIMPTNYDTEADEEGRKSLFTHRSEIASPSQYTTYLASHGILASVTAVDNASAFEFVYTAGNSAKAIIIDLLDSKGYVRVGSKGIYAGTAYSEFDVPDNFMNHLYIETSPPFSGYEIYDLSSGDTLCGPYVKGRHLVLKLLFDTCRDTLSLKCGSSLFGISQARINFNAVADRTFMEIVHMNEQVWNDMLGRVVMDEASTDQKRKFYSCLYRTLIAPRKMYEVLYDGSDKRDTMYYDIYDGHFYKGKMFLFDGMQYRSISQFPLLNLLYPDIAGEMYEAMYGHIERKGFDEFFQRRPTEFYGWALILSDALAKDFFGDTRKAEFLLRKMKAFDDSRDKYNPALRQYKDWALSYISGGLYDMPHSLSSCDTSVFNSCLSYLMKYPYDIRRVFSGNSGQRRLGVVLDSLFGYIPTSRLTTLPNDLLVAGTGLYFQGNPMMHHLPYLYAYSDRQWKSSSMARMITDRIFSPTPDGYSGIDICASSSAWYVFSSLGFYPALPVTGQYLIGSPRQMQVFLEPPKNSPLWISAPATSEDEFYVAGAAFDRYELRRPYITWEELHSGGALYFKMRETPSDRLGDDGTLYLGE